LQRGLYLGDGSKPSSVKKKGKGWRTYKSFGWRKKGVVFLPARGRKKGAVESWFLVTFILLEEAAEKRKKFPRSARRGGRGTVPMGGENDRTIFLHAPRPGANGRVNQKEGAEEGWSDFTNSKKGGSLPLPREMGKKEQMLAALVQGDSLKQKEKRKERSLYPASSIEGRREPFLQAREGKRTRWRACSHSEWRHRRGGLGGRFTSSCGKMVLSLEQSTAGEGNISALAESIVADNMLRSEEGKNQREKASSFAQKRNSARKGDRQKKGRGTPSCRGAGSCFDRSQEETFKKRRTLQGGGPKTFTENKRRGKKTT